MKRKVASVKWFDNAKGYGFLLDDEGCDVFIHYSQVLADGYKQFFPDDEVEYAPVRTSKGISAVEIVPLSVGRKIISMPAEPEAAAQVLKMEFTTSQLNQIFEALR